MQLSFDVPGVGSVEVNQELIDSLDRKERYEEGFQKGLLHLCFLFFHHEAMGVLVLIHTIMLVHGPVVQ